jgi:anti-sigma regulatory factor (Ser/Thr protein kinase)
MFAVPVDHAHGSAVRQRVRQLLEAAGFPREHAQDVLLALGEAFSNAVMHGTGSRREQVGVFARAHQRHVVIELRYPGEPFDTRPPTVPSMEQLTGRGRFLMTAVLDAVTYSFPAGETVVRLEKNVNGALDGRRCYCRLAARSLHSCGGRC